MARIFGQRVHGDRLRRLSSSVVTSGIADAVENGLERIVKRAQDSIIDGAVSGPNHVASAPGQPPNADTHELDRSGKVEMDRQRLSGKATFTAEHAIPLEFGTATVEERPFLKPAGQAERPGIRREVIAAVRKAKRGI